jgi:biotin operon repressor
MTTTIRSTHKTRSASRASLSDTALLLLAQAAQRSDGMVLPPPESIRARGSALDKLLQRLLKGGLVAEVVVAQADQAWRTGEDGSRIGLQVTAEGRAAIGIEDAPERVEPGAKDDSDSPAGAEDEPSQPPAAATRAGTKQALLIEHLSRPWGHSTGELAQMLGWQRHTVRAAITGLRKKGYAVVRDKNDKGETVYRASPPEQTARPGQPASSRR